MTQLAEGASTVGSPVRVAPEHTSASITVLVTGDWPAGDWQVVRVILDQGVGSQEGHGVPKVDQTPRAASDEGDDPIAMFGEDRVEVILARLRSGRFVPEAEARQLLELDNGL